ncbi:hypothetical protein GTQ45_01865 [Pyruvatibacter mobilis]|uniref:Uncharacterized protein n=1 Tax=Pyruvatibacter mobilis TaxID=1712261 RepID=A0A845Q7T2_9HYPH|nr:hypothetical protein [Pyruvatibacter mobilis]NBG94477.1 hypothetical protein [Pyruvatibacter mobilis]QJD73998.1 hypothetical protein HG718_00415 [Pyruvatibacter mobilis]GGD03266.1 hypothetical protein GCM10011587_03720 [Pyruvatibacter mobilis]
MNSENTTLSGSGIDTIITDEAEAPLADAQISVRIGADGDLTAMRRFYEMAPDAGTDAGLRAEGFIRSLIHFFMQRINMQQSLGDDMVMEIKIVVAGDEELKNTIEATLGFLFQAGDEVSMGAVSGPAIMNHDDWMTVNGDSIGAPEGVTLH